MNHQTPGGVFFMMHQDGGRQQAQKAADLLQIFLGPFEQWLNAQIDRRLVRTFFLTLQAIVRFRHSRSGLLLSELGAHVLSPTQAPAGTKRLSNLLRPPAGHTLCWTAFSGIGLTKPWANLMKPGKPLWPSGTRASWRSRRALPWKGCSGALQQGGPAQAHQAGVL